MWAVEKDPALRSDFCNLTILERSPDADRLARQGRAALVVDSRASTAARRLRAAAHRPARVAPDPTLDLDYHLRRVAAPGAGRDPRAARPRGAASRHAARPVATAVGVHARSTGSTDGRAALLQKVHHTITDGVGGLKLSLSLVDFERDPAPTSPTPAEALADEETPRPARPDRRPVRPRLTARRAARRGRRSRSRATREHRAQGRRDRRRTSLMHPTAVPTTRAATGCASLGIAAAPGARDRRPARSRLLAARSLGRRFEVFTVGARETRRGRASALGGSINDVFVTGVAGALGLYHERLGSPGATSCGWPCRQHRASGDDHAGNRFVPTRVIVPIEPEDPAARVPTGSRTDRRRCATNRALAAADSLAGLAAGLPTSVLVALTRNQARTIDFATSNLRGSPVALYLGGARIVANYPIGAAHRLRGERHRALLLRRPAPRLQHRPRRGHRPRGFVECFDESFDALLAIGV